MTLHRMIEKLSRFSALGMLCCLVFVVIPWAGGEALWHREASARPRSGLAQNAFSCADAVGIPSAECAALEALYTSTGGPAWSQQDGWLARTTPCDWYGVTCANGSVAAIVLGNNNLSGTLPADLSALRSLALLDLSGNQLTGTIPGTFGKLQLLQRLLLSDNQLEGSIPSELGMLSTLDDLWLNGNRLTGGIPASFSGLTSLNSLALYNNALTGGIPEWLGGLRYLEILRLGGNPLGGPIPAALSNLTRLSMLELDDAGLTGGIPVELGSLASLTELNLSGNALTGPLPAALSGMIHMRFLSLDHNHFYGSLPLEWSAMRDLGELTLEGNQLQGDVPSSWAGFRAMRFMATGYNMLTASDPAVLDLLNNNDPGWYATQTVAPEDLLATVEGTSILLTWRPIPYQADGGYYEIEMAESAEEGPFTRITATAGRSAGSYRVEGLTPGMRYFLRMRSVTPAHARNANTLFSWYTGTLSATIPTRDTLCGMVNEIPVQECQALAALYAAAGGPNWKDHTGWMETLTPCAWKGIACDGGHVTWLQLPDNHLVGALPPEIGSLSGLRFLDLSANTLTGPLPDVWSGMPVLEHLYLNANAFSGSLPPTMAGLSGVKHFWLNDNQLTGGVPAWLGGLASLEHLHLEGNHLTGSIPAGLGGAKNLINLHLEWNDLSGPIPEELGNLTNLVSLHLYHNRLSGSIPAALGNLSALRHLALDFNRLEGWIPGTLSSLTSLVQLGLSHNALEGEIPPTLIHLNSVLIDLRYNRLSTADPVLAAFINKMQPDNLTTQTVPPGGLRAASATTTAVDLRWTPIPYQADGGYYQVEMALSPDGPYTPAGTTASKAADHLLAQGLAAGKTYYFRVRAFTPAHGDQQNALLSAWSAPVQAQAQYAVYLPGVGR